MLQLRGGRKGCAASSIAVPTRISISINLLEADKGVSWLDLPLHLQMQETASAQ